MDDSDQGMSSEIEVSGNLEYLGEGNCNIVVRDKDLERVLRIRKRKVSHSDQGNEENGILGTVNTIHLCGLFINPDYIMKVRMARINSHSLDIIKNKIANMRPEHRIFKQLPSHGFAKALVASDAGAIPKSLINDNSTWEPLSIEIKPKFGAFCPDVQRGVQCCLFCMVQFESIKSKKWKNGRSEYCPCDLFSGQTERIEKAMHALLETPQNNFKVIYKSREIYSNSVNELQAVADLFDASSAKDIREDFVKVTTACLLENIRESTEQLGETLIKIKQQILEEKRGSKIWSKDCLIHKETRAERIVQKNGKENEIPNNSILDVLLNLMCISEESMQSVEEHYNEVAVWLEKNSQHLNTFLASLIAGKSQMDEIEERTRKSIIKVLQHQLAISSRDCSLVLTLKKLSEHDKKALDSAKMLEENLHVISTDLRGEMNHFLLKITIVDLDSKWETPISDRVAKEKRILDNFLKTERFF